MGQRDLAGFDLGIGERLPEALLKLLTCPLIIVTLGLVYPADQYFLFWLTGQIGRFIGVYLTINGFWPAFLGGLVVSVVSM